MASTSQEQFRRVVEHVFGNWTALQLAVEHSMGGPNSRQTALMIVEYMCNFCLNQTNVQGEDIVEALEDIMDEEFQTVCEDDSPKEIAAILLQFLNILRNGNLEQFELEFNKLPFSKAPVKLTPQQITNIQQSDESEEETAPNTMEVEDPEWTMVTRSRRKK